MGGDGDMRILNKAIDHVKAQSHFTYPFVGSDGKKDMLTEGYTCIRNVYEPGREFYGSIAVAGISSDSTLMGYIEQMHDDGRLTAPDASTFRRQATQFYFDGIDNLLVNQYSAKMPTTPSQPDFLFTDEENGIVSVKNGDEQLFVNLYYRDNADNRIVRSHLITDKRRSS